MRVLIVEDGYEYSETMGRYLGAEVEFGRAGDGSPIALTRPALPQASGIPL